MKKHNPSLVVELSFPDLVINVGEVTLGEKNRKKLQKAQRDQEKEKVSQAACALLNSGGGVIRMEMANGDEHPVEMGLDLEESLRTLIQSLDFQAFFEYNQQGRCFYIFVKCWNTDFFPEDRFKPRICSLDSSLHLRSATSVLSMDSREAFRFLETKKRNANLLEKEPPNKIPRVAKQNFHDSNPAHLIFLRDQLKHGEILPFPESQYVEFKQFSTKRIPDRVKDIKLLKLSEDFESQLSLSSRPPLSRPVYSKKGLEYKEDLQQRLFSVSSEDLQFTPESLLEELYSEYEGLEELIKKQMHPFSRGILIFSRSWAVDLSLQEKQGVICDALLVTQNSPPILYTILGEQDADGQLYCTSTAFTLKQKLVNMGGYTGKLCVMTKVLHLSPESNAESFEGSDSLIKYPKSYYLADTKQMEALLQSLVIVLLSFRSFLSDQLGLSSEDLQFTPESLLEELYSEYEGLEELIKKQIASFSRGILIFSRSWAVDLSLQEKQGVICDALLVTQNSPPILYTILGEQDADGQLYCTSTAFTLKQKLVNMGGYTGKLCVMTKVLHLSPESNAESFEGSDSLIKYPKSYYLADTKQMEALLQSLVIVLLSFRSFLSDQLGCEILNLLTVQQYEIVSKNLRKTPELFIHGLPGSGKTIVAMKIMEKIKNTMGCEKNEILYVCENKPLRDFIGKKDICKAVTRKTFMKTNSNFEKIQHIIIDEAQNFRTEDGNWYEKAKTITQRGKDGPGILWIFLDYFQTSHTDCCGLPQLRYQYPREELIRVVRNADPIANYLQKIMHEVRENPPPNIPSESLNIFSEAEWSQGVPGNLEMSEHKDMEQMVDYITGKCHSLLKAGYSCKDIAVICSIESDKHKYKPELQRAIRKRRKSQSSEESDQLVVGDASAIMGNHIVLDSVRRFSGLERNIVFAINPTTAEPAVFHNLVLCLASRARKQLYILIPFEGMTNSASF
ncbi:PREDICTED: schlafen family member 11 [Myotis davidii]|uniref:schlafen family member 11 n=1 Tax=Myotis davidii TaxID=225400 RepID=UPI000767A3E6|nr:PREDICTED: schlafen family member 11 [Myotis davidii]